VSWLCDLFKKKKEVFIDKSSPIKISTWCVPSSVFCAVCFWIKERTPVRIALQQVGVGVDHAQAEAFINGTWVPLSEFWNNTSMEASTYGRNYSQIEPYRYVGLIEFLQEQKQAMNLPE
jgi:hypothetical protein